MNNKQYAINRNRVANLDVRSNDETTALTADNGFTFEIEEEKNGKKSHGVYLIPNLITTASMLAAFFAITQAANGAFYKACLAVFLSAILDGMDGRAARMLGAQSAFGEQYDSLADMMAFGVAPAIILYHFALADIGRLGMGAAFIFVACAAFRLARFNVQIGVVDKRYFVGLASPLAALLIAASIMVGHDYRFLAWSGAPFAYATWIALCGLLMVSNVKYYSFKEFDRKKVPFVALIIAVLVMGIVLYDIPVGILAIGVIYAASGIIATLANKSSTKSSTAANRPSKQGVNDA